MRRTLIAAGVVGLALAAPPAHAAVQRDATNDVRSAYGAEPSPDLRALVDLSKVSYKVTKAKGAAPAAMTVTWSSAQPRPDVAAPDVTQSWGIAFGALPKDWLLGEGARATSIFVITSEPGKVSVERSPSGKNTPCAAGASQVTATTVTATFPLSCAGLRYRSKVKQVAAGSLASDGHGLVYDVTKTKANVVVK